MLIIFDMGGVVTTTAKVDKALGKVLGVTKEEFFKICGNPYEAGKEEGVTLFSLCSDGKITSREFWRIFSEKSGIAVQTDWWHWLFHPKMNEKTKELVLKLRAQGTRVVCGTNTIDSHYFNHLERGDYAIFDQTYASIHMGVSKPNPLFWKIILEAEECKPEDAVFIDDRKDNCDAASALGIHAIQFESAEQVEKELHSLGVL